MYQYDDENKPKKDYDKGYRKRPLWQWILLYLVIGGIIYYLIYYFATSSGGRFGY